jgi:DNA-binding MarR family transcriptional regulator
VAVKVDTFLLRAREAAGTDRMAEVLRSLARDVAHLLSKTEAAQIAALRTGLAGLQLDAVSYEAGLRDSVLEVLAAGQAARERETDEEQDVESAVRENWAPVLSLLRRRPMLPTEVAAELELNLDVVSRRLDQLRTAGLAEAQQHSADGRKRPHRLTLSGERIAKALPASLPEASRRLIRFAVRTVAALEATGRLTADTVHSLSKQAFFRTAVPHAEAADLFTEELTRAQLAMEPLPGIFKRIELGPVPEVLAACVDAAQLPKQLLQLPRLNPGETTLLVRSDRYRDQWNTLFAVVEPPPHWRSLAVSTADLRAEMEIPKGQLVLVYDNTQLMKQDQNNDQPWMAGFRKTFKSAQLKVLISGDESGAAWDKRFQPDLHTVQLHN